MQACHTVNKRYCKEKPIATEGEKQEKFDKRKYSNEVNSLLLKHNSHSPPCAGSPIPCRLYIADSDMSKLMKERNHNRHDRER